MKIKKGNPIGRKRDFTLKDQDPLKSNRSSNLSARWRKYPENIDAFQGVTPTALTFFKLIFTGFSCRDELITS